MCSSWLEFEGTQHDFKLAPFHFSCIIGYYQYVEIQGNLFTILGHIYTFIYLKYYFFASCLKCKFTHFDKYLNDFVDMKLARF